MACRQVKDREDIAHNLLLLKMDNNQVVQDNIKLRTKNKNLEAIVETLYEDLDQYQQQIERMYQGKSMTTSFIQGSLLQGVKR